MNIEKRAVGKTVLQIEAWIFWIQVRRQQRGKSVTFITCTALLGESSTGPLCTMSRLREVIERLARMDNASSSYAGGPGFISQPEGWLSWLRFLFIPFRKNTKILSKITPLSCFFHSLSNCVCVYIYTHTHTHTHTLSLSLSLSIYIYIYI
jgi:hypothetical protein